ncbi:MAG: M20/M25/M40 family metallo-hydrolase [Actinobacteria bacterium]|nr:MAG: M20/M25/M40 family metallo-hydrolase [Actinomycetota bacterium]
MARRRSGRSSRPWCAVSRCHARVLVTVRDGGGRARAAPLPARTRVAPLMATVTLREEATDLLQRLIRLDTVNPPGNETLAAELLRDYLADNGVLADLYARVPERANLVARIPGQGGGPRLLLLSHTDTVLADAADWQFDPWSGELRDGEIWGRGALDMKGQVAANAVAIASLSREGFEPSGDLIFAATADEEVGEDFGLSWLCREHPDAVRAEYCVNEGAGDRIDFGEGRIFYLCSAAEKMSSPFRLSVHGRSGHASMPGIADNALVKAATLIMRLAELRPEPRMEPEVAAFLRLLVGRQVEAEEALEVARRVHPIAAELVEPLLSLTVAPTIISASQKRNVIPALCDLICDCRLLPSETQDEAESLLRETLGPGDYDFEWLEGQGGTRSPIETPLWEAIESFVAAEEPEARVAPVCLAGFTDSHWLREAFGTVAYGFFPMRTMDPEVAARLVHSADERIAVEDLELGVRFLRHVARQIGG